MDNVKSKKQAESNAAKVHPVTAKELGFNVEQPLVSADGFSVWVRSLMQNWRQGTVSVKGRSEVARTNKKPWKQKGTGRARAGSARSPLWRGGGVTFGPSPRVASKKVPDALKKKVSGAIVAEYANKQGIVRADWQFDGDKPSTKKVIEFLKSIDKYGEKVTIFASRQDHMLAISCANIPGVHVLFFDQPNAYALTFSPNWIVLDKDFDQFKQMVSQWT